MKKFVIVSSPRSGTRMLSSMLNSIEGINCWNEILRPDVIIKPQMIGHPSNKIFDNCNKDEKTIIDIIFNENNHQSIANGFVAHFWNGLEDTSLKYELTDNLNPWPFLVKDKDIYIIHLQRQNKFRRFISHVVANNNEWHWLKGNNKPKLNKVWIDKEVAISNIKQANIKQQAINDIFCDHKVYNLFYEDLSSISGSVNLHHFELLIYYGLCIKNLNIKEIKSSTNKIIEDYSSVVENWDEVKDLDICS